MRTKLLNNRPLVFVAALVFLGALAVPGAADDTEQCKVKLNKDSIQAQTEPQTIEATLTGDFDFTSISKVEVDSQSGLDINIVKSALSNLRNESDSRENPGDMGGEHQTSNSEKVTISIDSSMAKAGRWELAFYHNSGVCKVMLTVEPMSTAEARER
jgi:hypothetical protein